MSGLAQGSGLPDNVRSYDLVWQIYLVGAAHQSLHCTAFLDRPSEGDDEGGNVKSVKGAKTVSPRADMRWHRMVHHRRLVHRGNAVNKWTIMIEAKNEFGEVCPSHILIDKHWKRLRDDDIGLSIYDSKTIMKLCRVPS